MDIWAREIASAGTGMAPGLCALVGGRPRPSPCLRLLSCFVPKTELPATITLDNDTRTFLPDPSKCNRDTKNDGSVYKDNNHTETGSVTHK